MVDGKAWGSRGTHETHVSPPALSLAPRPADPPSFRERTLARLVDHVRTLIPIDGVTFMTVDQRGTIERTVGWFADEKLRDAFDGLLATTLERDRALFLPRVDAWEAAPTLLAAAGERLGARPSSPARCAPRSVRCWASWWSPRSIPDARCAGAT
jgi:hypothetical protein